MADINPVIRYARMVRSVIKSAERVSEKNSLIQREKSVSKKIPKRDIGRMRIKGVIMP